MSLIKCPDCEKLFSDRIDACPNCGCPKEEAIVEANKVEKSSEIKKAIDEAPVVTVVLPEELTVQRRGETPAKNENSSNLPKASDVYLQGLQRIQEEQALKEKESQHLNVAPYMVNNDKRKSLLKDIAIVSAILGPLLFIIIGGIMWSDNAFDGTIMEQLFPAMFFGFIIAWGVVIILSNLFKNSTTLWIVGATSGFIVTVICYMLGFTSIVIVGLIGISIALCLLVLIRWITSLLK